VVSPVRSPTVAASVSKGIPRCNTRAGQARNASKRTNDGETRDIVVVESFTAAGHSTSRHLEFAALHTLLELRGDRHNDLKESAVLRGAAGPEVGRLKACGVDGEGHLQLLFCAAELLNRA
jgi:hypothetical protein